MRTGTFVCGAICVASLGLCHAAQAAETGFYAGLSVGKPDYEVGRMEHFQPPSGPPIPIRQTFENDGISWSGTLGYRMHTYAAVELGYASFASVEEVMSYTFPLGQYTTFGRVEHHKYAVKGPTLAFIGILPIGSAWETYLRAGVLFAELENEALSRRLSSTEEWLAGAGVQWNAADAFALRLEYQRIDTIESDARIGDVDVDQVTIGATLAF